MPTIPPNKEGQTEYRCTRNAVYSNHKCQGHKDLTARHGYYIWAKDENGALEKMNEWYPRDGKDFTVQKWKTPREVPA